LSSQHVKENREQTTADRKLPLVMGKFKAEDVVQSIQNFRCTPEIVPVQVNVW